jgi:hypothetical protein
LTGRQEECRIQKFLAGIEGMMKIFRLNFM